MTMGIPGSWLSPGVPSFSGWTPDVIEALPEGDRKYYLEYLRKTREDWEKKMAKAAKGNK